MQRLYHRRLYPFEALAEIFDFVAGLVQRVPKKPSIVKADLQNSTASQGDRNWEGFSCRAYRLWKQNASATPPNRVILSGDGTSESKDLYNDILNEDDSLS